MVTAPESSVELPDASTSHSRRVARFAVFCFALGAIAAIVYSDVADAATVPVMEPTAEMRRTTAGPE
jgi:hypothetical protein